MNRPLILAAAAALAAIALLYSTLLRSTAPPPPLKVEDLAPGSGRPAEKGDTVSVHYVGRLQDGKEFDNSRKKGKPLVFILGVGSVIKGWDQGMVGMKPGGRRRLVIPPHLAYGEQGTPGGPIPPNATLIFEVEMLKVEPAKPIR